MSNINDALKMKGRLQIHLNDELVQEVDNLVVTAGKGYVASRIKDASATAMSHMAIGSGTSAAGASDTALGSQLGRVALTSTNVSAAVVTYVATFAAGTGTGAVTEAAILNASSGGTHTGTGNFGQDSTFGGLESAGGYSDANGNGDFHSSVTSPYLSLCTDNLPEPNIVPNSATQADDHFNTLIYDGNDDATRTFDVGFVSDFSWFKASNADGIGHQLYDSSRGVQKYISSNTTDDETTNTEGVTMSLIHI